MKGDCKMRKRYELSSGKVVKLTEKEVQILQENFKRDFGGPFTQSALRLKDNSHIGDLFDDFLEKEDKIHELISKLVSEETKVQDKIFLIKHEVSEKLSSVELGYVDYYPGVKVWVDLETCNRELEEVNKAKNSDSYLMSDIKELEDELTTINENIAYETKMFNYRLEADYAELQNLCNDILKSQKRSTKNKEKDDDGNQLAN